MPLILRKPGSEFQEDLPGYEGVVVTCRTLSKDDAKSIQKEFSRAADDPEEIVTVCQKAFGRAFVRLEGLGESGDESLELEQNGSGGLTDESMGMVVPIIQPLMNLVLDLCGLSEKQQKNSRTRQR